MKLRVTLVAIGIALGLAARQVQQAYTTHFGAKPASSATSTDAKPEETKSDDDNEDASPP